MFGSWWRTGKSDVLQFMGSQSWTWLRDWTTALIFIYRNFRVFLYALFLSQYTQYFLGGLRHSQCSNYQCSHELQSCISSSDQPLNSIVTGATGYQASLLKYFVVVQSPCHVPLFAVLCTPNLNIRRRQWHPTPVLLPGKYHGWRSLVGYSPWGRWGSDTTERLSFHFSFSRTGEGNGNPLQCSCLENPRDGGAWWAAVYGVAQSWTWLKWLSIA